MDTVALTMRSLPLLGGFGESWISIIFPWSLGLAVQLVSYDNELVWHEQLDLLQSLQILPALKDLSVCSCSRRYSQKEE